MIFYLKGNLLESNTEAIVNTVNLMGVMGKGIALEFKNKYKDNFLSYKKACIEKTIDIGKPHVYIKNGLFERKIIINLPTKNHWKNNSEYLYIEKGLEALLNIIKELNITSISLPKIGCGNGGLDWEKVKNLIEKYFYNLDCKILIYE
jgi:O-acetyl-ADP-ribose deacetylase (regulator of RNase III)